MSISVMLQKHCGKLNSYDITCSGFFSTACFAYQRVNYILFADIENFGIKTT
ncbi:hypothetical protein DSM106044_02757 [Robinsoniella peoriensis]|uniref:Uncharacterized protein n=1 Tax=Robinsoniella peoriensis TaxID=180332 RepID=A0A4U8QF61_9FIRM|nr:hypothetical protein DSM106044_02757 [Robinsoniella peoriensis]